MQIRDRYKYRKINDYKYLLKDARQKNIENEWVTLPAVLKEFNIVLKRFIELLSLNY